MNVSIEELATSLDLLQEKGLVELHDQTVAVSDRRGLTVLADLAWKSKTVPQLLAELTAQNGVVLLERLAKKSLLSWQQLWAIVEQLAIKHVVRATSSPGKGTTISVIDNEALQQLASLGSA